MNTERHDADGGQGIRHGPVAGYGCKPGLTSGSQQRRIFAVFYHFYGRCHHVLRTAIVKCPTNPLFITPTWRFSSGAGQLASHTVAEEEALQHKRNKHFPVWKETSDSALASGDGERVSQHQVICPSAKQTIALLFPLEKGLFSESAGGQTVSSIVATG